MDSYFSSYSSCKELWSTIKFAIYWCEPVLSLSCRCNFPDLSAPLLIILCNWWRCVSWCLSKFEKPNLFQSCLVTLISDTSLIVFAYMPRDLKLLALHSRCYKLKGLIYIIENKFCFCFRWNLPNLTCINWFNVHNGQTQVFHCKWNVLNWSEVWCKWKPFMCFSFYSRGWQHPLQFPRMARHLHWRPWAGALSMLGAVLVCLA